jgi:hypothetical protein
MKKVDNWNDITPVVGGGESLPAGVYECGIVGAYAATSKKGNEMLVLALEVTQGEYQGIFTRSYKRKKAFDEKAKWPCLYYQLTEGDSLGRYKGLIESIQKSNPGYAWDFNEATLKGLKCACIFREEEYVGQRDGEVHSNVKPYQVIAVEDMANAKVPAKKCVKMESAQANNPITEEEIPF